MAGCHGGSPACVQPNSRGCPVCHRPFLTDRERPPFETARGLRTHCQPEWCESADTGRIVTSEGPLDEFVSGRLSSVGELMRGGDRSGPEAGPENS